MRNTTEHTRTASTAWPVSGRSGIAAWRLRPALSGLAIIGAFIIAVSACRPVDTSIDQADAASEILAATDYKAKECGQRPPFVLIPPDNVDEHALRLCSILITRATCPFNEYPMFCSEMYGHIPGAPQ